MLPGATLHRAMPQNVTLQLVMRPRVMAQPVMALHRT